jgi:hypothetical protein
MQGGLHELVLPLNVANQVMGTGHQSTRHLRPERAVNGS